MYSEELYIKDNIGNIRVWKIMADYDNGDIIIEYGVLGGAMQIKVEHVPCGKVNRSRNEQVHLQLSARVKKQQDKGYHHDINIATNPPVNTLGMPKPMLAQMYTKDVTPAFVQRKYDGNRCLVTNVNGKMTAYTRNGKPITSLHHILPYLEFPNGWTIDGELYCHGERLQTIVSWIKCNQPETANLEYVVYDVVSSAPFSERLDRLLHVTGEHVGLAPTYPVSSHADVVKYFKQFRAAGYEGAIIRTNDLPYEDGKRSKSLLKLKEWYDYEFKVVDIHASKDDWAILTCELQDGGTFRVSAPGTIPEREEIYKNRHLYIGKYVTVEYAYLTADGVPFHPRAKAWRTS